MKQKMKRFSVERKGFQKMKRFSKNEKVFIFCKKKNARDCPGNIVLVVPIQFAKSIVVSRDVGEAYHPRISVRVLEPHRKHHGVIPY